MRLLAELGMGVPGKGGRLDCYTLQLADKLIEEKIYIRNQWPVKIFRFSPARPAIVRHFGGRQPSANT
jgi:hypothetical protein